VIKVPVPQSHLYTCSDIPDTSHLRALLYFVLEKKWDKKNQITSEGRVDRFDNLHRPIH
jgi:hypothetical protein